MPVARMWNGTAWVDVLSAPANMLTTDTNQTITGTKTFNLAPLVPDGSFAVSKLSATGTRDATTYLRGDGTWAVVQSGTAANVVTSSLATAKRLTVNTSANPPATPESGDLWVVPDLSNEAFNATGNVDSVWFGSDPATPRPNSNNPVLWVGYTGTVPTNARADFDVINTFSKPVGPAAAPPLTGWRAQFWSSEISGTTPTDGAAIPQWNDRTAGLYHAANTDAATQPIYRASDANFNTRPVVDFTSVSSRLITPQWASMAQPNHIVLVASVPSVVSSTQRIIVDGAVDTARHVVMRVATNDNLGLFAGSVFSFTTMNTAPHLIIAEFNGASSRVIVDGVITTKPDNIGAQALTGLTIGTRVATHVDGFVGKAAYVGVRPGTITAADADSLLAWARDTYGTP